MGAADGKQEEIAEWLEAASPSQRRHRHRCPRHCRYPRKNRDENHRQSSLRRRRHHHLHGHGHGIFVAILII